MAQSQKKLITPQALAIPGVLEPIVEAFSVDSEKVAKALLKEAVETIYFGKKDDFCFESSPKPVTKKEIDGVYALMKSIKPTDIVEILYGVQIIVGHLLGMRKLAQPQFDDQNLGLKLLKLSSEALERLERKRGGGNQNINVTYHNSGPSMQSLVTPSTKE